MKAQNSTFRGPRTSSPCNRTAYYTKGPVSPDHYRFIFTLNFYSPPTCPTICFTITSNFIKSSKCKQFSLSTPLQLCILFSAFSNWDPWSKITMLPLQMIHCSPSLPPCKTPTAVKHVSLPPSHLCPISCTRWNKDPRAKGTALLLLTSSRCWRMAPAETTLKALLLFKTIISCFFLQSTSLCPYTP